MILLREGTGDMDTAVKTKKVTAAPPVTFVKKVGVIGAGQMGNGIAHVVALAGYEVVINDLKKEALEKAVGTIERNLARQVSRGLVTEADMKATLKRIGFASGFKELSDADLVVEAATEDESVISPAGIPRRGDGTQLWVPGAHGRLDRRCRSRGHSGGRDGAAGGRGRVSQGVLAWQGACDRCRG